MWFPLEGCCRNRLTKACKADDTSIHELAQNLPRWSFVETEIPDLKGGSGKCCVQTQVFSESHERVGARGGGHFFSKTPLHQFIPLTQPQQRAHCLSIQLDTPHFWLWPATCLRKQKKGNTRILRLVQRRPHHQHWRCRWWRRQDPLKFTAAKSVGPGKLLSMPSAHVP